MTSAWGLGMYERNGLDATFTSNVTPVAGFPLTRLNNRRLQSRVRFDSGLSSLQITMHLGANAGQQLNVGMLHGNFSVTARCRFQIALTGSFVGADVLYDSNPGGAGSWPLMQDISLDVGNFAIYAPPFGKTIPFLNTGNSVAGDYVRWTIDDASNPDGYVEVGIADAGLLFQPSLRTFDESWVTSADPVGQGAPGDDQFPMHKVLRWHEFEQSWLTATERARLHSHLLSYGPRGRMLFLPRPFSPETWRLDAIWSVCASQPKFSAVPKQSWLDRFKFEKLKFLEVDE